MTNIQLKGCVHLERDEGYHELIWYDTSAPTVDEYIDHVAYIYTHNPPDQHLIRWLFRDAGVTTLPAINYFSNRIREIEKRFPDRPHNRIAILYGRGIRQLLLNALVTLANMRGRNITRFFPLDGEAEALAWLLDNK